MQILKEMTQQGSVFTEFSPNLFDAIQNPIDKQVVELDGKQIILLHNVFTENECDRIIKQSELCGFESISHIYEENYRNNLRIMVDDTFFTNTWYRRMEHSLSEILDTSEFTPLNIKNSTKCGMCSMATLPINQLETHTKCANSNVYRGICMNPRLRICKYNRNGIFAPHYDSPVRHNGLQSIYTVMAYLNDVPAGQGGATRFFSEIEPDSPPIYVNPKKGSVVIFIHNIAHDGERLRGDAKYIMRSDIMIKI